MKLILVRHGETSWNRENRLQGQADIPVNVTGQRQAECAAMVLAAHSVGAVISSPLQRALMTAKTIAAPHALPVEVDPAFLERHRGRQVGLVRSEVRRADNLGIVNSDGSSITLSGNSEPLMEVQRRGWGAVEAIIKQPPRGDVVIVSHDVILRAIISAAIRLRVSRLRHLSLSPASISMIEVREHRLVLTSLNDVSHLPGRKCEGNPWEPF